MDQLPPPEEEIRRLLQFMTENQASDLHIKVHYPPYLRIGGHLRHLQQPPIPDTAYVLQMVMPLMPSVRPVAGLYGTPNRTPAKSALPLDVSSQ